jgi:hypothetical protein
MVTKREQRLKKQTEIKSASNEREVFKIPDKKTNWKKYAFWIIGGAITSILLIVFFYKAGTPSDSGPSNGTIQPGQSIDGIPCQAMEVTNYHVHAHLIILVSGTQRQIEAGIGIANPSSAPGGFVVGGTCFMWLHTHDSSGIIHIEAPSKQDFTLGQFFDIWGKVLSSSQIGNDKGSVAAYLDGKKINDNPRDIKLSNHESIVLMLGKTVNVPANFNFTTSGL